MKIKKIKKFMFCFLIYLLCFANGYGAVHKYITSDAIGTVSLKPASVIKGVTPSAEFTVTVRTQADRVTKGQYIELKEWKYSSQYFVTVEEIFTENGGSGRNKVRFKEKGDAVEDTLEYTVRGKLKFDWKKYKSNPQMILKIGEVYSKNGMGNSEYIGDVLISLETLDMIDSLRVKVLQHMDFGTVIAGGTADTERQGQPAKVSAEGVMGENVKFIMPVTTKIVNKNGDKIEVTLRFRGKSDRRGNEQTAFKNLNQRGTRDNMGSTEEVIIDGTMKTRNNNLGEYKGNFTVRVEYDY